MAIDYYNEQFKAVRLSTPGSRRRRAAAYFRHVLFSLPFVGFILFLFFHHSLLKRAVEQADARAVDLHPAVERNPNPVSNTEARSLRKAIVAVSVAKDNTTWINSEFPDWDLNRYIMDIPQAGLEFQVPQNRGGESMGYLTYIIDNYADLPDFTVFLHAARYQWHNEDPLYDGVPVLRNLQLHHVDTVGYVNLRCTWSVGCPGELRPNVHTLGRDAMSAFLALVPAWLDDRARTELRFGDAMAAMFPEMDVPRVVGVPCCNQFAVAKWKILRRPLSDYVRYRQWLMDTPLENNISGRVMEYVWHIMMGMPPVYCQDAGECFCQKFGLCDLKCTFDRCENRFAWPPNAPMPLNWPDEGPGTNGWPERDWYLGNAESEIDETSL